MPPKDKSKTKKKFKAKAAWSNFTHSWPGNEGKVKLKVPFSDGTRKIIYITPGEVVETEDWKAKQSLENWRPPPILVNGEPWVPREAMFEDTNDPTDQDLD
jgi:hypothetical protein